MAGHNRSRPCPSLGWVGVDGEQILWRTAHAMLSLRLAVFAASLWVRGGVLLPSGCFCSSYVAIQGI
jgi:hypothetical protein